MSSLASDEISRLERLEGQVLGIPGSVPHMQEDLERLRARAMELTRGLSSVREGQVNLYDFLELRGTVGRFQAEITSLRTRIEVSPTPSRVPAEGSKAPVPVYAEDRSTLSNVLKRFQTRTSLHEAGNGLVTEGLVRVVGHERSELGSTHGREKVNQSIAVWTGLMKGIEKDITLLDIVITAGSPSEAWKILLSLVTRGVKLLKTELRRNSRNCL